MALKMEFDVEMTCGSCKAALDAALGHAPGVDQHEISLEKGSVVVTSSLPSAEVLSIIEGTGRRAVLKGYGSLNGISGDTSEAAVAMLGGTIGFSPSNVAGVVRFVQSNGICHIDGTIDGLSPGQHGFHIHEFGDISQGVESAGGHFDLNGAPHGGPTDGPGHRHTGDLGNITADETGRASFRITDDQICVGDIIGRSVVVTEGPDDLGKSGSKTSLIDGNSGRRLSVGIISRSAGLFQNPKKICACDGVTLWDERNVPAAGKSRREFVQTLKDKL